jgi:cation transport regulator ChaB
VSRRHIGVVPSPSRLRYTGAMPRKKNQPDIPSTIARSDRHAQEIYQETHDSAVKTYGEGEAAHRVAFASLKHSYRKEGDRWVPKKRKGPSDERAAHGVGEMSPAELDRLPTAGGHLQLENVSRAELYRRARELEIRGRSTMDREELAEAVMAAAASKDKRRRD